MAVGDTPIGPIVGNITSDPELRDAGSSKVASFTIAVTPRTKVGETWEDGTPTFLRCSAWRELGEHVAASLPKGTRVLAYGTLGTRKYTTKEGEERESMEVTIESIGPELRFATAAVTRAGGTAGNGRQQGRPAARASEPRQTAGPAYGSYDDSIPF